MFLSRLDTQRIVNPKNLGYPKDSFVSSDAVELEWDEENEVVYIRRLNVAPSADELKKNPKAKAGPRLAAIVPLDCVAFMWPADE